MKTGFYPKLAFDGIRKNRRMYVPFICTCIGMVMMFYIISYLHYSDTIASMNGGQIMRSSHRRRIWPANPKRTGGLPEGKGSFS